jgi:DNA repair exonuclease SbcCD ATPase subunit
VLEVDIDKRADVERALDRAISTTSQARNALLACDKELDRTEEAYEKVEKEVNPFIEYLERAKEYERTLHDEVDDLRARIADAEGVHYIKQMWVTGFKEIRLREIASALSELEVEVNSAVVALGLNDWSLEFAVDRELKGGTVQRGFNVTVRAPDAKDKPVPWEAWSGGEKQRLRIAGNAGLSDLVRARTGCGLQLEVWDEPTNGLSPEGKTDLFEYLAERARNEARIIILLDHQAHDFGGFAGTCTIIKTPSGSRIRHSW